MKGDYFVQSYQNKKGDNFRYLLYRVRKSVQSSNRI